MSGGGIWKQVRHVDHSVSNALRSKDQIAVVNSSSIQPCKCLGYSLVLKFLERAKEMKLAVRKISRQLGKPYKGRDLYEQCCMYNK